MEFGDYTAISLTMTSIVIGAFLGALGNKLSTETGNWVWAFYITGILTTIISLILTMLIWNEISDWDFVIAFLPICGAGILLYYTITKIDVKNIFRTNDLHPIINKFTEIADKNEIKLFGGDLNFFGESVNQIDVNPQYTKLKSLRFNKVLIICEQPKDNDTSTKIRYGKILTEIPNVELRFYNPDKADLRVRGRILKVDGVSKLLMFNKLESKKYKTIETDTANSNGALYNNIWNLIWSLANRPEVSEMETYKILFNGH